MISRSEPLACQFYLFAMQEGGQESVPIQLPEQILHIHSDVCLYIDVLFAVSVLRTKLNVPRLKKKKWGRFVLEK